MKIEDWCMIILFSLGTSVVIFGNSIVGFLFKYLHFEKIFDLDRFFLSAEEKKEKKYLDYILNAPTEELEDEAKKIIKLYGKLYHNYSRCDFSNNLIAQLPGSIRSFFNDYDYISIDECIILDVKKLEKIVINDTAYIVIGLEDEEGLIVLVEFDSVKTGCEKVYCQEYHSDINDYTKIDFCPGSYHKSFYNFICFYYQYYKE